MRGRIVNNILKILLSVTWKAFCIFGENDIELLQIPATEFTGTEIIPIELEDLEALKEGFHIDTHQLTSSTNYRAGK